jgi:hypothetical protein
MRNAIKELRSKADDCESQARAVKGSLIKAELFDITARLHYLAGELEKSLPAGIGNQNPSRSTYQRTHPGCRQTACEGLLVGGLIQVSDDDGRPLRFSGATGRSRLVWHHRG